VSTSAKAKFFSFSFVYALFVRRLPGASIGYQKHLLSLKVMMSKTEQGLSSFMGGFGQHGSQ